MSTTLNNGTAQRKQLSAQLDRLDTILDGLADAIPDVVADTIRTVATQVVREAVQAAVSEVLTNPALLEKLRPAAPVAQPAPAVPVTPKPTLGQQIGSAAQAGWAWLSGKVAQVWGAVSRTCAACASTTASIGGDAWAWVQSMASGAWALLVLAWALVCRFRKPLLIATGVGVVIGLGCYFSGPVVASTVSGLAGFGGSLLALGRSAWRSALALVPQNS